jgi:hypothetical protein
LVQGANAVCVAVENVNMPHTQSTRTSQAEA